MSSSEVKITENNTIKLIIDEPSNPQLNSIIEHNCDTKRDFHGGNAILTAMFDHWFKSKM